MIFVLMAALAAAVSRPVEATRQVFLMGTACRITAYGPDRAGALAEIERCVEVLEATESELSTWRRDSPLGRLNASPVRLPFAAGPALCRLFETLACWQRETASAFDPGIGALVEAWGVHGAGRIPSPDELGRALERSGMRHFAVDTPGGTITRTAGATVDSGAFGKGEALDRALRSRAWGAGPWLIDLGGQMMVAGAPPGRLAWSVDLCHPSDRARPLLRLQLASGSLATSGGSERDLQVDGRRVGHILDPRTGRPAEFSGSVTVWHQSGLVADILSTALYVMGPDAGMKWAEAHDIAACFAIPSSGPVDVRATRSFRRLFF